MKIIKGSVSNRNPFHTDLSIIEEIKAITYNDAPCKGDPIMDGQITQTEEEEVRQSDEYIQRLNRLEDLRSMGVEPFGEAFDRTHRIEDLVKAYDEAVDAGDDAVEELPTFKIAGRVMSMRGMGKASCN